MVTKVWDITNTGFKCQIMVEEGAETSSSSYNVNYMAITPGIGVVDNKQGLMIAAGSNKSAMYGTANRATYFMLNTDTVYTTSPYIFAQLQTKNYDAATLIHKHNRNLTEEKDGKQFIVGSRFKRITDPNKKTTADGTKLNATSMKDDLGWIVLFQRNEGTSEPTDIKHAETTTSVPFRPYIIDSIIYVDGYDTFEVYNTAGIKLNPHQPQQPGIYVVRIANATAMVVVK